MAKFGKWIGAGLGWAFLGPIGALVGYAFGSMLDGSNEDDPSNYRRPTTGGDFAVSLLVLAAAVMKADGKTLKSELDFVKNYLERSFGPEQAGQMVLSLREILKRDVPLKDVCLQIKRHMQHAHRLQLLHFLFGISKSDGHIHSREVEVIGIIAAYLGISSSDFNSIKAMFAVDRESPYKVLGVSPNDSDDVIKKSYRKLAIKHHPDKVASLGEDIQKAAKEKFQQVQSAYDVICKERGIN